MIHEEPFFFRNSADRRLFGVFHRGTASHALSESRTVLVYCHPLFEEKLEAHRVGVNFARRAARDGFDLLRFDYYGDGDSEGVFQDTSAETRIADIHSAISEIRRRTGSTRLVLIGSRMGATLALVAAERSSDVTAVVAWAPILNVGEYLYDFLRSNLTAQLATYKKILEDRKALLRRIKEGGMVNVEGYLLTRRFYEEGAAIEIDKCRPFLTVPVLAVAISSRVIRTEGLERFAEFNPQASITVASIQESEFWNPQKIVYPACEELFGRTLGWIQSV